MLAGSRGTADEPTRYWIGVISREHVLLAVRGGFCQFNHGKEAPVRRLQKGDRIVLYSPTNRMGEKQPLRCFTATGRITDDAPYQFSQTATFHPFRRKVDYFESKEASIEPLLSQLAFTHDNSNWGFILRRGFFEIEAADYALIAKAMQVAD